MNIEQRLWAAADELWANSNLKSSEFCMPVLGLIFLRYADHQFYKARSSLKAKGSQRISKKDFHARGLIYLPPKARLSYLLSLPNRRSIGKAINDAMIAIEVENEHLRGMLPKKYHKINNSTLRSLLESFSQISTEGEGDIFGKIYEAFLEKFALAEGLRGGEFYTPTSLTKLIVQIIEPYSGKIYDPACGSGGMFTQSSEFIQAHRKKSSSEISCYGIERAAETRKICLMNLAVHGLSGNIRQANSYYEDPYDCVGRFDYTLGNPPFNVSKVDTDQLEADPRFPFGMPKVDNANYLWIQLFYSSLCETGRAGFIMPNSAAETRQAGMDIRKQLIQTHSVDVMVAVGPYFFRSVVIPCMLWFLDRGKTKTKRKNRVLFIDARKIFRQVDKRHREFSPRQIEFIANIVRLYRHEKPEFLAGEDEEPDLRSTFPKLRYRDVSGLCQVATLDEIEENEWSLNPGRYVGIEDQDEDYDYAERLEELSQELKTLNGQARRLERRIDADLAKFLEEAS